MFFLVLVGGDIAIICSFYQITNCQYHKFYHCHKSMVANIMDKYINNSRAEFCQEI